MTIRQGYAFAAHNSSDDAPVGRIEGGVALDGDSGRQRPCSLGGKRLKQQGTGFLVRSILRDPYRHRDLQLNHPRHN